jgi:hypothetical protein
LLRQRTKSVVTTDFSVRITEKSIRKTIFGRLDHKPNFPLGQQIIFFGVAFQIWFEFKNFLFQSMEFFKMTQNTSGSVIFWTIFGRNFDFLAWTYPKWPRYLSKKKTRMKMFFPKDRKILCLHKFWYSFSILWLPGFFPWKEHFHPGCFHRKKILP